jgi:sacsin
MFAHPQANAAVSELRQESARREAEVEALRAAWQCRVCFSHDVDQAFTGCGHTYCSFCMPSLARCPVCRVASAKVRLFR